ARRMSGAAYAAWVENARLRRMNGYGSKLKKSTMFPRIHTSTITVWMTMNFQLPRNAVTPSAIRPPSGASPVNLRLTGARLGVAGRRRNQRERLAAGVRFDAVI